ncbi:MAG: VCBS repeat-containing protein [Nitrospirae bacterium]|nr:VCBS repeat-containing protein [Nitrospirota bacterium]
MKQDTSQRKQSKGISAKIIKLSALFSLFFALCSSAMVYADDAPLHKMRDEVISYFKPMTGKVTMVEGKKVVFSLGAKDNVKTGMRFTILREGSTFIHPVTKEPLGKLESSTGKLEVKEVGPDQSTGYIITGDAKEGDKIRISESKVSMLFCQSNDIDWYLADSLYRVLKETGRFNMIDTDIETDNPSKVIEEAKKLKAEVALLVTAKAGESGTLLTQRLFWANDSMKFSEMEAKVDVAYAKKLRFGEELFISQTGEAWLQFDMPYGARFITIGDIDGDGKQEILLSTGKDIRVYTPGIDLQPALGGVQITGYGSDDHLWVDTIDLNKNGIDEVIITSLGGDDVTSYIYELRGTEFILLFKGNFFLRRLENRLIAQAYSKAEGFDGDVFSIIWDGEYKKGDRIKLPKGVNIYDFVYVDDPHTGRVILAYDEDGFLNIYDEKGIRIWRSKTDMGGFLSTFKKSAPTVMIDRGKWSIKDKLMLRNREVLFVKRVPLFEMAKGLGYKSSQIKNLWWNGLSMEESVLIDDIRGSVIDYAVAGDKIIVLASPMFGIKHENILKGENPLRTMLYIYSMKGR